MKNRNIAVALCVFTGALGGHHYYLGNWKKGVYRFLLTCLSIIIVLTFINEHINMLIPLACYVPLLIDFIRILFDSKYIANYKTANFKEDMSEAIKMEEKKAQFRSDKKGLEKERITDLKKQGIPYCPKCHSTSLTTTNKKLSVGRALVGGALIGGTGVVLGGLTSKKVELLCMNCGYKFKPGKK